MRSSTFLALAASLYTPSAAVYQGFNYGSTKTDGSVKVQADFEAEFKAAKGLVGNSGFTSARLYTTVQSGGGPISAIPAAIAQDTSLLLGIWASGGSAGVTEEINALTSAISQYGTAFTDLVVGLSVGSEDLYRNSPTGIAAKSGIGADPATIVSYITQVKSALAGTALSGVSIGHVDTWTAWVNGSNSAVVDASDWIGVDAYPYFQNTQANGIENGKSLFTDAYSVTQAVSSGKPVWITETGWPVSGDSQGDGVPSLTNAKTYYDEVGCGFAFGNINTWWYTLQDAAPTTPNPSFGVVDSTLSTTPLYDLSCSNITSASSSASSSSSATATGASGSIVSSADSAATAAASAGGALSPSQGAGNGGAAILNSTGSTTLTSAAAGSTGTSGSGSGSSASNGTYTSPTKSASGTSSATASSTVAITSSNAASAISGSVVGIFGGLLAMMVAL